MWRRLPVLRSSTCAAAVRRHLCFSRRLLCSPSSVLRSALPASPPAHDNFFVDIDSLAGYSEAPDAASRASHGSHAAHAQSSPEVLGVVRQTPEEEGARYSRLHIPLGAEDEAGNGTSSSHLRSNTRAGLEFGEEAQYADESVGPATTAASNAFSNAAHHTSDVGESKAAESASVDVRGVDGRLPDPAHLPYDDERFAAMVLEMEVNGVIDETWQDAKKAHLEDVKEIADILTSLKVHDLCCIDVSEKTSNFDYMMFGTCEGARHIHLAAWAAQDADKVHRLSKVKRKQTDELWEVVPIGRIVLNLMVESFREEMTLERKWAVTRAMDPLAVANAPISEGRQVRAHGLWTLTLNLQDLEDFEVDYCKDILMRQM